MFNADIYNVEKSKRTTFTPQNGGKFRLVPEDTSQFVNQGIKNATSLDENIKTIINDGDLDASEKIKLYQQALLRYVLPGSR